MQDSLLSTKLFIPQVSQKMVHRSRLIDRLNQSLDEGAKLTLISAPAGYGKTTLVTKWLAELLAEGSAHNSAWLSLDEADNTLPRFLTYLIAAFQQIDPVVGAELQSILESDSDLPKEPILTALVNDIADCGSTSGHGSRYILVLDDYYLINDYSIHEALDFLIDHIPPCLHLIILTRVDPPIPLGRLRVLRELSEVRQVDLQFTNVEATIFLNSLMGLNLSPRDISDLNDRTEGWIAGLQLAALSLTGAADKHDQIISFSGSHRHLVDYLAHEVMSRQNEDVQSFLLRTSILERFNASLCDAVTGVGTISTDQVAGLSHQDFTSSQRNSRKILDQLEFANMFLIALDDDRQWYRYHRLFADFLYQQLHEVRSEIIPSLYIRASQWHESQGMVDEAMENALSGGNEMRAARILDENAEILLIRNAEVYKILHWAGRLSEEVRAQFPQLCVFHAWALQFEYQLDASEHALTLAETKLKDPHFLADGSLADQLMGHIRAIRSYIAFKRGEINQSIEISHALLRDIPEDADANEDILLRGAVTLGLGIAYLGKGELNAAYQAMQGAMPMNQRAGNRYGTLSCLHEMIGINVHYGALNRVVEDAERGLLQIEEWSRKEGRRSRNGRMLAGFRRGLGLVQYERNELDLAAENLKKATDYSELTQSWLRFENYAYMIDLYNALGDDNRAVGYFNKLKRLFLNPGPELPGVLTGAFAAQRDLTLSQSRPEHKGLFVEALRWARNSNLQPSDEFQFSQEYEYTVLARVLIAQRKTSEAIPLLDRLINSAVESGRSGDLIRYLAIQATAHHCLDNRDAALIHLSRAMALSEPEGFVRTFVDLGPRMNELMQIALSEGISPIYTARVLTAFRPTLEKTSSPATLNISQSSPDVVPLTEPLNEREMQILRLMSARLSNREIADELYLSVNTVKWYARSIFEKLGVSNRRDAGSRARELGILVNRQ